MDWIHFFGINSITVNDILVTIVAIGNGLVVARQKAKDDQIAFLQDQVKFYKDAAQNKNPPPA